MLQLPDINFTVGTRIDLPESWHEKVVNLLPNSKHPYELTIVDITKHGKEIYFLTNDVAFTSLALRYLYANEVDDTNTGLYFDKYLPIVETSILITSLRDANQIIPAIFKLELQEVEINGNSIPAFTFVANFINGKGFSEIRHFVDGPKKSTFKFLYHSDESYMSDYEKMFKDTIIHKQYIKKSIEKLASWLDNEGATNHAMLLRERAICHDNSKLSDPAELYALSRIINDKTSLSDPSKQLTPFKKEAIKLHHKNNSHHPEHFSTPIDMSKIDIMEMCCDWHARSAQFGTNFLDFVLYQQEHRFLFPDWMFSEILQYCKILDSEF